MIDDRRGAEGDGHCLLTALRRAARGKKITRPASRGISRTRAPSRPLAGRSVSDRDRGPHALLERPAELRDEALSSSSADLDVTLGDQLLAVSRAHAGRNFIPHYVTRRRGRLAPMPARRLGGRGTARRSPSTSTARSLRPISRRPSRTASEAIARAARRRL